MMSKSADANQIIDNLTSQLSQLIKENAVLTSIVSQYEEEEKGTVEEVTE